MSRVVSARSGAVDYFPVDNTGAPPVSAFPFSMGCFWRYTPASVSSSQMTLMCLEDRDTAGDFHALMSYGTGSGSGFSARSAISSGTDKEGKVSLTVSASNWYWVLGVWDSATDRRVYLCDTSILTAQNTASIAPTINGMSIGVNYSGTTASNQATGLISCPTVWEYGFSTAEVTDYWGHAIAAPRVGFVHPNRIRPDKIVFQWEARTINSTSADDQDNWEPGYTLQTSGAPAFSEQPPLQLTF